MEQSKKVPVLRFPEFSGEWECKTLGELSEISSGGTPNRANQHFWNGSIPWVSTALIDFNLIDRAEEYITEEGLKNSSAKLYPVGTLLMAMYGQGKTRGKIAILNIEASTNQACASIITNKEVLNNLFAFQNISKRYNEIRDLSNQGGQENLSGGIIKKINISFPSIQEQQKIADFLTQIDNKINQLSQKKQLLERYKKGVMQQIFNQSIRFTDDDGREFPEWEEREIGNEVDFLSGYPFDGNDIQEDSNGINLMRGINITEGYIRHNKDIDKYYLGEIEPLKKYLLKENDLVIGMDGSKVGKNSALIKKNDVNTLLVQRVARLRAKKYSSIEFIYQHIISNKFYSYVDKVNTSSGIPHISAKHIKEFRIFFPCIKEQTKIANFLTALDNKIALVEKQLNGTKQYKKGLLQQLFI
jgi:type I restriction enzyme S subunit